MQVSFRAFIGSVRWASGKKQDFFLLTLWNLGYLWRREVEKLRSWEKLRRLLTRCYVTRFEEQHSRFGNKIIGLMKFEASGGFKLSCIMIWLLRSNILDEIAKRVDIQEELRVDKWLSSKNFTWRGASIKCQGGWWSTVEEKQYWTAVLVGRTESETWVKKYLRMEVWERIKEGRWLCFKSRNQKLVRQQISVMRRILVEVLMKGLGCRGILQGNMYQVIWSSGALEN